MNENPLTTTILEPFSLVMRFTKCYYCGSDEYYDTCISDRFGIRHCGDHATWARRDCNAYLHINKQVSMYDIKKSQILQDFTKLLTTNSVYIMRSCGELQPGWIIRACSKYSFERDFITYSKGEWLIPMKHQIDTIQKHVSLMDLLREENKECITKDLLDKVHTVLENGLYKKDYLEQKGCRTNLLDPTEPEESPNIQNVVCKGRECRIYINPAL